MTLASKILAEFLRVDDFSLDAARKLETELDQFRENKDIEDLLDVLASYCPGGGEFLYDKSILEKTIRMTLACLAD